MPAMIHPEPEPEAVDWAGRYATGETPWDKGVPHPELAARLAAGHPSLALPTLGGRALVPGCGRGHDALALAAAGWEVVAVDVVPSLTDTLAQALADHGGRFVCSDALEYEDRVGFDLLFDHTFFCAIQPGARAAWGALARRVVREGGRVCSLVFPIGRPSCAGGPPFGVEVRAQEDALGAAFELVEDVACAHPFCEREWGERWATFARSG
jgi:SAM-dependent methyltransferase